MEADHNLTTWQGLLNWATPLVFMVRAFRQEAIFENTQEWAMVLICLILSNCNVPIWINSYSTAFALADTIDFTLIEPTYFKLMPLREVSSRLLNWLSEIEFELLPHKFKLIRQDALIAKHLMKTVEALFKRDQRLKYRSMKSHFGKCELNFTDEFIAPNLQNLI